MSARREQPDTLSGGVRRVEAAGDCTPPSYSRPPPRHAGESGAVVYFECLMNEDFVMVAAFSAILLPPMLLLGWDLIKRRRHSRRGR